MKFIYPLIFLVFITNLQAQNNQLPTRISDEIKSLKQSNPSAKSMAKLFALKENQTGIRQSHQSVIEFAHYLTPSKKVLRDIALSQEEYLEIFLPVSEKMEKKILLRPTKIFAENFQFETSNNPMAFGEAGVGKHFQGIIEGEKNSLVALSFYPDQVTGFLSYGGENYSLAKLEDSNEGLHILFKDNDLKAELTSTCFTSDDVSEYSMGEEHEGSLNRNVSNCVNLYLEVDYDMYQSAGNDLQMTTNYITGLMNQVITLYNNESITLVLSQLKIWDTPDPYTGSSTGNYLNQFQNAIGSNFNGDLAHLIGLNGGGGVAYVDVLCFKSFAFGYSAINTSYNTVPTYSWSVNVVAHELGHNFGSPHTHACAWNNNNTALDGCGPQAGYSEGCNGPVPSAGTIMSYCHLINNVGIDFSLGFGTQPGDLIRLETTNASCLSACTTCTLTASVNTTDTDCQGNNGTATVTASAGTPPYQYNWSNGGGNSSQNNLTPGAYSVTVSDADQCSEVLTFTINTQNNLSLSLVVVDASAPGSSDGGISLTVSGGIAPYTYSWSNGATSQNLTNLSIGTYTVAVTDSQGCTSTASAEVSTVSCDQVVSTFPYDEGFESGLGVWQQSTDDDMNWSRRSSSTPSRFTGPTSASEGNFYIYTEASGNAYKEVILESSCIDLSSLSNPSLSFDYHMYGAYMGDFSVDISTNNGTSWNSIFYLNGDQGNSWRNAIVDLSNVGASLIKLRLFVNIGYGYRSDVAIDQLRIEGSNPPCVAPQIDGSTTDVLCAGQNNGSIDIDIAGGVSPYSYAWSDGNSAKDRNNLSSGGYSLTVTDAGGCESSASYTINQPNELSLAFTTTDASAPGMNDGSIDLQVNGGTGPYIYLWSHGPNTADVGGLSQGDYTVTVTDSNGCQISETASIEEPNSTGLCGTSGIELPYDESFEAGITWEQDFNDDFNWTRDANGTPSRRTGPSDASHGNYYLYTEASGHNNDIAIINSPCFDLRNSTNPFFKFDYHMYGSTMGTLALELSDDGGTTWTSVWSRSGQQGNQWRVAEINLSAYAGSEVKFRFKGSMYRFRSDMAIDNIEFYDLGSQPAGLVSDNPQEIKLTVFPNPATDYAIVEIEQTVEKEQLVLTLIDNLGRVLEQQSLLAESNYTQQTIQLEHLPNGVYLVVIQCGESQLTQHLVKY